MIRRATVLITHPELVSRIVCFTAQVGPLVTTACFALFLLVRYHHPNSPPSATNIGTTVPTAILTLSDRSR